MRKRHVPALLLAAVCAVLPAAASPVSGATLSQRMEPSLPQLREETAAAAVGNRLYVIGGYDAAGSDTASVFVFDGLRWGNGPALPLPLDHPSATALNGRLYLAGGFDNGIASRRVFVLSRSGRSWSELAPLHHARGALALVPLGSALYALGGKDGSGVEIAPGEAYSVRTGRWSDTPPLPLPRDHVAGFAYHGRACVAGGRSPNTSRVDCYEPVRHIWSRLPDLPVPTSGAGAAVLNRQVMVGGGELAAEGGGIISQLARLVRGRWVLGKMLVPRHGIEFAVFRGRVWACGGGVVPGLHPTAACTSIR